MPGPRKQPDDSGHESGTHKPETGERCWGRQGRAASSMFWRKYGEWDKPLLMGLAEYVKANNAKHLEVVGNKMASKCPFATGCEIFHSKIAGKVT